MTKYEEARIINRVVRKSLKKIQRQKVCRTKRSFDLPAYITDNPFYP